MDRYDHEDKGLFTFYREQADIEQTLVDQKLRLSNKGKNEKEENNNNITQSHVVHKTDKYSSESVRKLSHNLPKVREIIEQVQKDNEALEIKQHPDKIIELLEKHKYASHGKPHFKVIMKIQDKNSEVNAQSLKMHLQELMGSERATKSVSKLEENKKDQNKQKLSKDKKHINVSPFKKIALLPTSFSTNFQEINRDPFIQPKIIFLNDGKNRQLNKINKIKINNSSKAENGSQIIKHIFPRIQKKANSEIVKKQKVMSQSIKYDQPISGRWRNPVKQIEEVYLKPIQKQKSKQKNNYSLNIECINIGKDLQNGLKSMDSPHFIMYKHLRESKLSEEKIQNNKDKILMDIVKKLKFK